MRKFYQSRKGVRDVKRGSSNQMKKNETIRKEVKRISVTDSNLKATKSCCGQG